MKTILSALITLLLVCDPLPGSLSAGPKDDTQHVIQVYKAPG